MVYLEDLIVINEKLSLFQLIYKKFNWKWSVIVLFFFAFGFILLIMAINILPIVKLKDPVRFFAGLASTLFSGYYFQNKTQIVIENNYKYALKVGEKWSPRTVLLIAIREFEKLIENKIILNGDTILFLIEALKHEKESKKYNYYLLITFVTIFIGAFVSAYLSVFISNNGQAHNMDYYLSILDMAFMIFVAVAIIISIFYVGIIREFVTLIRDQKNRLIRILENIYLEKFANSKKHDLNVKCNCRYKKR